jgi:hypothetical protein
MDSNIDRFDDLRPVKDDEVSAVIKELLSDQGFKHAIGYINPGMSWEEFNAVMIRFTTKFEFQSNIIAPIVAGIANNTSLGFTASGWDNYDGTQPYTFISNHRDIILDAGLLNVLRHNYGQQTTEIAIGDNLFVFPWIEKLVRLNKSFVVRRGVSVRQMWKCRSICRNIFTTRSGRKKNLSGLHNDKVVPKTRTTARRKVC